MSGACAGSVQVEHTIAQLGASRLWRLLHDEPYVHSLSAVTGNQALQHVAAGLKAIYVSGWQVAADANNSLQMYPDQSLYPSDSVPYLLKRINNALQQADLIHHLQGRETIDWFVPLVADAEAASAAPCTPFELMKAMIDAGAAGVISRTSSRRSEVWTPGRQGLVPTPSRDQTGGRTPRRPTCGPSRRCFIARTDANSASLLTSDVDPVRPRILTGERTHEGLLRCSRAE